MSLFGMSDNDAVIRSMTANIRACEGIAGKMYAGIRVVARRRVRA